MYASKLNKTFWTTHHYKTPDDLNTALVGHTRELSKLKFEKPIPCAGEYALLQANYDPKKIGCLSKLLFLGPFFAALSCANHSPSLETTSPCIHQEPYDWDDIPTTQPSPVDTRWKYWIGELRKMINHQKSLIQIVIK